MRIEIGEYSFPSKAAAVAEIRRIKDEYPLDTPLLGDDAKLITALLGLHPDAAEKTGPGIQHITIRAIEYGARGFWVTRTDGSCDDFSYKTALNGDLSHTAQVKRAMRFAIDPQIKAFKDQQFQQVWGSPPGAPPYNPDLDYFHADNLWATSIVHTPLICPITNNQLDNNATTHVDHHNPPFAELIAKFVTDVGGFDNIRTEPSPTHPGQQLCEPTKTQWIDFHQQHATLRLIHRSANLARARTQ